MRQKARTGELSVTMHRALVVKSLLAHYIPQAASASLLLRPQFTLTHTSDDPRVWPVAWGGKGGVLTGNSDNFRSYDTQTGEHSVSHEQPQLYSGFGPN